VNEEIIGAVLGSYESVTLLRVEPLNGAGGSPSVGHGSWRGGRNGIEGSGRT